MIDFFKYLPVSEDDVRWGLPILNAGANTIAVRSRYPTLGHPDGHQFDWQNGRVLDEFQIIYIHDGRGLFESRTCGSQRVDAGTIILLFPQEWHRFKPDASVGWKEYWVGFKGEIASQLTEKHFFSVKNCLFHFGKRDDIHDIFLKIFEQVKSERPGYQQILSGMVLQLIGHIYAYTQRGELQLGAISEQLIFKAQELLRDRVNGDFSIASIAKELQVSYAWFRKAFKTYTGMAPHQYLLQLKIQRSRTQLSDSDRTVKEIAFELGFNSPFYFSKIFRAKTGCSPDLYRRQIRLNCKAERSL